MKKIVLLLFLMLFFYRGFAQSPKKGKTAKVTYVKGLKSIKDHSDTPPKRYGNVRYKLIFNDREARFEHLPGMAVEGDLMSRRIISVGDGLGVHYRSLPEQVNLYQEKSSTAKREYLIQEDYHKYNWNLSRERKEVLGYTCYKAIGSYKEHDYIRKKEVNITVEVWYTPSIPVPFGPAGIDDLPGLVLEAKLGGIYYFATAVDFDSGEKIKRPTKGRVVNRDQYNREIAKDFFKKYGDRR